MVYGIKRSDGPVVYVGQTKKTAEERFSGHKKAARLGSKLPIACWLRKYSDAEVVILKSGAIWNEDEIKTISELRAAGIRLLNCTAGGMGCSDASLETRAKMRAAKLGKKLSSEHRANLSASKVGTTKGPHSNETKQKIANALRGANSHTATMTEAEVVEIKRELLKSRPIDVARSLGLPYGRVYAISKGWNWGHVCV